MLQAQLLFLQRLMFIFIFFCVFACAVAQQVPPEVRYKKADDAINQKAGTILENALAGKAVETNITSISDDAIACGPLLWDALKLYAGKELFEAHRMVAVIGTKPPLTKEGRGFRTQSEKLAFWKLFVEKVRQNTPVSIRKAKGNEIQYYWATIPFDIEEPLFVADLGKQQVLVNFTVKNGEPKIFWMDIIGDLAVLSSIAQSSASSASHGPPTPLPRVVEDKNVPAGWKRYQFVYGGGDILSMVLPSAPEEYEGKGQVATDVLITMMTHALAANTKTAGYTGFYASDLSVAAEQMTEKQKATFYESLWMGVTKGAVKAFAEAGQKVETSALEKRVMIISGQEGIEQNFSVGPLQGKARMILAGHYAYGAFALWGPGTTAEDVEAFLSSFQVRKN